MHHKTPSANSIYRLQVVKLRWAEEEIRILDLEAQAAVRRHEMEKRKLEQQNTMRGVSKQHSQSDSDNQLPQDGAVNKQEKSNNRPKNSKKTPSLRMANKSTRQPQQTRHEKEHPLHLQSSDENPMHKGSTQDESSGQSNQSPEQKPVNTHTTGDLTEIFRELPSKGVKEAQDVSDNTRVDPSRESQSGPAQGSSVTDVIEEKNQSTSARSMTKNIVSIVHPNSIGDEISIESTEHSSHPKSVPNSASKDMSPDIVQSAPGQGQSIQDNEVHEAPDTVNLGGLSRNLAEAKESGVNTHGGVFDEKARRGPGGQFQTGPNLPPKESTPQSNEKYPNARTHRVPGQSDTPEILDEGSGLWAPEDSVSKVIDGILWQPTGYTHGLLESWIIQKRDGSKEGQRDSWSRPTSTMIPISQRKLKRYILRQRFLFQDVTKRFIGLESLQQQLIESFISCKTSRLLLKGFKWELLLLHTKPNAASGYDIEAIHIILKLNHDPSVHSQLSQRKNSTAEMGDDKKLMVEPAPKDFGLRLSSYPSYYESLDDNAEGANGILTRMWSRLHGQRPKAQICRGCLAEFKDRYSARFHDLMCCTKCREAHRRDIDAFHAAKRAWEELTQRTRDPYGQYAPWHYPGWNSLTDQQQRDILERRGPPQLSQYPPPPQHFDHIGRAVPNSFPNPTYHGQFRFPGTSQHPLPPTRHHQHYMRAIEGVPEIIALGSMPDDEDEKRIDIEDIQPKQRKEGSVTSKSRDHPRRAMLNSFGSDPNEDEATIRPRSRVREKRARLRLEDELGEAEPIREYYHQAHNIRFEGAPSKERNSIPDDDSREWLDWGFARGKIEGRPRIPNWERIRRPAEIRPGGVERVESEIEHDERAREMEDKEIVRQMKERERGRDLARKVRTEREPEENARKMKETIMGKRAKTPEPGPAYMPSSRTSSSRSSAPSSRPREENADVSISYRPQRDISRLLADLTI